MSLHLPSNNAAQTLKDQSLHLTTKQLESSKGQREKWKDSSINKTFGQDVRMCIYNLIYQIIKIRPTDNEVNNSSNKILLIKNTGEIQELITQY